MIPTLSLDTLHDAMKAQIAAKFTGAFVDFYPRPGEAIKTPAILLEIEDMPADDPDNVGTEQLAVTLNVNAYCVLSYKAGNKKALRTMAANVLAYVRGRRWGQPVQAAKAIGAFPDRVRGGNPAQPSGVQDDYEVMRVEFTHEVLLGADIWDNDGAVPTEVWLGYAPEIGPDHIDDYDLVTRLPEEPIP